MVKPAKKKAAETPAKKERPLTTKQRKLIKGIVEGKTQKQAAIDAGYSEKGADARGSQEIKKDIVKATLQEMMKEHGLDDASLLKVHAEMIQATKVVSAIGGKDAGAGSVDFIDVPDWQARGKGIEMAYKLTGAFVEKKEITFPDGIKMNINFVVPCQK